MGFSIEKEKNYKMDEVKDRVVVLLGKTGVGKSSFINSITNKKECEIGDESDSCTHNLKRVNLTKDGFNYYFIDTPGLDDGKGDEKNISCLGNLRSYPRTNVFLICMKFNDIKLSESLKNALKIFMEIFPSKDFWEHVLIIRTWTIRGKNFEDMKNKYQGKFLEGLKKDSDLLKFMKENNINVPSTLKEFYVDSMEDKTDFETKIEYGNILEEIKQKYSLYKEVKIEDEEIVNEETIDGNKFLHIITNRHITFLDFNDEKHELTTKINEERYNLNGISPILTEVKREQNKNPRGILCFSDQYRTSYKIVKYYSINGSRVRQEYEYEYRWEKKGNEIKGEEYRQQIEDKIKNTCQFS